MQCKKYFLYLSCYSDRRPMLNKFFLMACGIIGLLSLHLLLKFLHANSSTGIISAYSKVSTMKANWNKKIMLQLNIIIHYELLFTEFSFIKECVSLPCASCLQQLAWDVDNITKQKVPITVSQQTRLELVPGKRECIVQLEKARCVMRERFSKMGLVVLIFHPLYLCP